MSKLNTKYETLSSIIMGVYFLGSSLTAPPAPHLVFVFVFVCGLHDLFIGLQFGPKENLCFPLVFPFSVFAAYIYMMAISHDPPLENLCIHTLTL